MNYKKMGIIGTLCAMGALAPQKVKGDTYIIEEPIYTTAPVVYETAPVVVQQGYYNNGYYGASYAPYPSYYRYNNEYSIFKCDNAPYYNYGYSIFKCDNYPRYRYGSCAPAIRYNHCAPVRYNHCAPARPHFNHCAPARPHFNHCAPARPHFNHCAPRGGFRGHGPSGFHHGSGPRGGRCR